MRRYWPFLVFAGVALIHVVVVLMGQPGMISKAVLMPSLLAAVIATVLVTARVDPSPVAVVAPMLLLEFAILTAWFADFFFFAPPDVLGIAASGVVHVLLVVLFAWPLRARWRSWVAVPYALALVATVVLLWPSLGASAPLITGYAVAAYTMAYLGARIGGPTGIGGALYVVSAIIKAFEFFVPQLIAWVPTPVFDAVVMGLYGSGIGLVAFGSVRAILAIDRGKEPLRRASAERWGRPEARRGAESAMR